MIHSKAPVLPGLLAFALLPVFTSTRADTDRNLSPLEPRISQTRTADDPQSSKKSLPGKLSWIRGTLLSWTSDSLTLQPLKPGKKSLTLELSLSPQIIHAVKRTDKVISVDQLNKEELGRTHKESLAVGSAIQVHYFEQHNKFYAIVIIEETNPIPASVEKSGSSYLGVLEQIEVSTTRLPVTLPVGPANGEFTTTAFCVRVDGRTRRFYPGGRAPLVDSAGHRLAMQELKVGDTLLITYRLDIYAGGGDTPTPTVLEIRNLTSQ